MYPSLSDLTVIHAFLGRGPSCKKHKRRPLPCDRFKERVEIFLDENVQHALRQAVVLSGPASDLRFEINYQDFSKGCFMKVLKYLKHHHKTPPKAFFWDPGIVFPKETRMAKMRKAERHVLECTLDDHEHWRSGKHRIFTYIYIYRFQAKQWSNQPSNCTNKTVPYQKLAFFELKREFSGPGS